MPDDLEEVARVLGDADAARVADLAELEDVDPAELADFLSQPDPDTDGMEHD